MNPSSSQMSLASDLNELGFCTIRDAVSADTLEGLIRSVEVLPPNAPGARNLAGMVPQIARLSRSPEIAGVLENIGCQNAFLVRSIFFDKQPGANWKVPWHQDITIAVRERREVEGFGPWSEKTGIPHVQPPASILETMITLRLHLDDCDAENGALKVLPRSHRHGVLNAETIQRLRRESSEVVCAVPQEGILAMRPLLLHASSPALRPKHRRVIHLEFATKNLTGGLMWIRSDGIC